MNEQEENEAKRFRILVAIDGSEESYSSLRYAARLGQGVDADITLLYVRRMDQGLNSGGLQVRVARENILEWGLDLPGIRYLRKGREILIEEGHMEADWEPRTVHKEVLGDPLGDHMIEYVNDAGKLIRLRLRIASDIESGILDQQEQGQHQLILLGSYNQKNRAVFPLMGIAPVALKVALHAPCSVIVTREMEQGRGHLLCVDGSPEALEMVRNDAQIASRCQCPVTLFSVARDEAGGEASDLALKEAEAELAKLGITPKAVKRIIGNPVEEICTEGKNHSVIVLSGRSKQSLKRFFMGNTAMNVIQHAVNTVMVVR
ncbi:MAG: universal stress protein [Magnetococcales bacterium]|nr:universal stress protein [Magnetococcales bacterium]